MIILILGIIFGFLGLIPEAIKGAWETAALIEFIIEMISAGILILFGPVISDLIDYIRSKKDDNRRNRNIK